MKKALLCLVIVILVICTGCSNYNKDISFTYVGRTITIGDSIEKVLKTFPENYFYQNKEVYDTEGFYYDVRSKEFELRFSMDSGILTALFTDSEDILCPWSICVGDRIDLVLNKFGTAGVLSTDHSDEIKIKIIQLDKDGNKLKKGDKEYYRLAYFYSESTSKISEIVLLKTNKED